MLRTYTLGLGKIFFNWTLWLLSLCLLLSGQAHAFSDTFTGINNPGESSDSSFYIYAHEQHLRLQLAMDGTVASHILLKQGAALVDNSDYDHIAQLNDADNTIDLDLPELQTGNWYVRVLTPAGMSGPHNFTLRKYTNANARPSNQTPEFTTTDSLSDGLGRVYEIDVPAGQPGAAGSLRRWQ